jgi:16S rRNA (guanine966-N2)-methyltransferase
VRVIAGSAKGTRLAPVPSGTRPLSDRAREGLFSSLGGVVDGARVLDLYAGTGAVGIEALSRGAERAVFVDSAPPAVKTIHDNLARTKLAKRAMVRRQEARQAIRSKVGQFDLVFLDPPYRLPGPDLDGLLAEIAGQEALSAGAGIVLTRSTKSYTPVIPVDWKPERRLLYGDALILVFRA